MSEADKEIEDFLKYLKVADEVCKEKGKMYDFKCPLCNGNAKAIKIPIMDIYGRNVKTVT